MGTSQQNQLKAPWHSCKIEIQLWEYWRAGKLWMLLWTRYDFLLFPLKALPQIPAKRSPVLLAGSGRDPESLPRKERKQGGWVLCPSLCRGILQAFLVPSHPLCYATRLDKSQVFPSLFMFSPHPEISPYHHMVILVICPYHHLFYYCVTPCAHCSPLRVVLTSSTRCPRPKPITAALAPLTDRERAVWGLEQGEAAS